jgi:translation initiation factor IF-2
VSGIPSHEVECKLIRTGVGAVGESDIDFAAASHSEILTFNTPVAASVRQYAKLHNVTIGSHTIIYTLIDYIKEKLSELLPPIIEISVDGEAQVLQIFSITIKKKKVDTIAGCKITNGKLFRNSIIRIMRNGVEVFKGFFFQ